MIFKSTLDILHRVEEKEDIIPDVDDTDGLDPEGEFEAWRLRELERIKKEKEEELRREEEREEIERRRALPEEQRMKEDVERANKLREEKPKGQQKFLQKYWHKGAFHQDDDILQRRDYTEATESTVDVSSLPKVMQVKNFGKRSRTKYTHLLDQDTTAGNGGFGGAGPVKSGGRSTESGGCFVCGGPHLKEDCPQNTGPPPRGSAAPAVAASRQGGRVSWRDREDMDGRGERDRRSPKRDKPRHLENDREPGWRRRDRGYRDVRTSNPRSRSSRSRSPRRDKRSPVDYDRDSYKRRRVD